MGVKAKSIETLSYGQAMERLEQIVQRVERGDVDVDELAASVKEAAALVRMCRERLRRTQADVEQALSELEQAGGGEGDGASAAATDGITSIRATALEIDFADE